ncbi:methylenetetrahydrofolate--tRNA-(uracil(54)-C(5))-methyltransferase (FADH(2)-oxidizing) TrmFO [bacterium]|nr:methylenetetrahydrofolate--tRNA-(uracil(54)-C(5))-methyltransferase (FADH(2)-oxidizing) TrmFO [bacterium]
MHHPVTIIGGGLAGSEAALQLAARGIAVELWEQRPAVMTAAHTTDGLAELVCSNSLKSTDPARAAGLLKEELTQLGCRLLPLAFAHQVPGGAALCVDRERFSRAVTELIAAEPLITLRRAEFTGLPELVAEPGRIVILASGPLTSGALWAQVVKLVGDGGSYFYDATAPIISVQGIDRSVVFAQSRYEKGGGNDYLNCPFTPEEYLAFREALVSAEQIPLAAGDDYKLFEGCLPIEELARRGVDTMRFGPLKPKGLTDPRTGRWPYAAVQLRWEDALERALSLVGFQTRLRFGEQDRVFRLIPGLAGAHFTRHGRMHRNSYLDAPRVMAPTLALKAHPRVLVAGQLTGLEGYMAAVATGLWAGINAALLARGGAPQVPPEQSCLGAMFAFMANPAHSAYAPTAFSFGMCTWLPGHVRRDRKLRMIREGATGAWAEMRASLAAAGSSIVGEL